ncbi:MAG: flagellar basal body-associated FliL family protein [Panacagrimonas sp.]
MVLGAVLLCTAGAGGAAYMVLGRSSAKGGEHGAATHGDGAAEGESHGAAPPSQAVYLGLEPAFVVNLESGDEPRYLQADVQLMARDAVALEAAKSHVPLLRNTLLMLFGQQKPADLATRAGKEKLQQAALVEVRRVLQAETGKPVVEAVYFTSFVMQ